MNQSFMKHEFIIMSKSKKNIIFIIFLTALLFSYCFFILPNEQTSESFDPQKLSYELEELSVEQKKREEDGYTGINVMTGVPVYAMNKYYYKLHSNLITAFEDQDFTRFVLLRTHYLEGNMGSIIGNPTLFPESPFPGKDRKHLYQQTLLRYQGYLDKDLPISYALIEQKTALQTLQKFLLSSASYLIIFCAVYFSSDIVVRDRQNRTILQGLPLSWYRVLNIKTIVAFLYTIIVLSVLLIVGMFTVSLQSGFGFFNIQMPIMIARTGTSFNDYDSITIFQFIVKAMIFIPILVYLFTRLSVLLSLLFKNEWLVLLVSTIVLFSERLYYSRTLREIFGIEVSYFPQTYFEFGKVVSGDKNFLVNLDTITYVKGIIVLMITIVIIEGVLYMVSRIINKRRFYQTN
ncbi:hypothetical protein [Sporosarcina sp. NPDC096371]|uniref:hypothetical protein n=1 Tax=Sporosarcina sp. NPDC096371 TaxID=3364530 RepID=UPI003819E3DA